MFISRLLNPEAKLLSISYSIDSSLLAIARHLAPPFGQSSEHNKRPLAQPSCLAVGGWAGGLDRPLPSESVTKSRPCRCFSAAPLRAHPGPTQGPPRVAGGGQEGPQVRAVARRAHTAHPFSVILRAHLRKLWREQNIFSGISSLMQQ